VFFFQFFLKKVEILTVYNSYFDVMTQYLLDMFVDFDDYEEETIKQYDNLSYVRDGKQITFDDNTMQYYKTMRTRNMDPISLTELPSDCFKFDYQWDAYTGERLDKDPFGPLCFDPDTLIKYYYENRLNGLWNAESDESGGYFEGYYDVAVGAGQNITIKSRGDNPERYLFRLPIIDCYWLSNVSNETVVTMGPKLTDEEIKAIDVLASKQGSNYENKFGVKRPSICLMKNLYDMAIADKLPDHDENKLNKANRQAVDQLRKIRG